MSTQFSSTSFLLSQWAEEPRPKQHLSRIELDIVEDPTTREVCTGNDCALYYDAAKDDYIPTGNCCRNTLCTETRILKDSLYLESGTVSPTNNCISYNGQLRSWRK